MKRSLTALLVVVAACHSGATPAPTSGASSPTAAVNAFLAAGKAQDLQAMGAVWGTAKGPARTGLSGVELANYEKNELIMVHLLCQDQSRIVGESQAPMGNRTVTVELKHGSNTATLDFTTVVGPASRWYVGNFQIEKLQGLCR